MDYRCITLFTHANGGVVQTSFCFERSALNYARELGVPFVIAIRDRVLHTNTNNALAFMRGSA